MLFRSHTSDTEEGQIYIPQLNWAMLVLVLIVVLVFRNSSDIATAYGISVSGTMLLDSLLVATLIWALPGHRHSVLMVVVATIALIELTFLIANSSKFVEGGWFPLAIGLAMFTLLTSWKRGQTLMRGSENSRRLPLDIFTQIFGPEIPRVQGTAVYLTADPDAIPTTLMHNLKHNKIGRAHV